MTAAREEPGITTMVDPRRQASTCRWAVPTLFLDPPLWLSAEAAPWACTLDTQARLLDSTDPCAICPRWEPAPDAEERHERRTR